MKEKTSGKSAKLRLIPSVTELLARNDTRRLVNEYSHDRTVESLRYVTDRIRREIKNGAVESAPVPESIVLEAGAFLHSRFYPSLKRVINATGTILHTNLGRSVLADAAIKAVAETSEHYSNLEFNLETGLRGSRHDHLETLVTRLTGAEAGIVVNNNAAAVMLILSAFARGKETVVSRGELVEIGGSFRMPAIMEESGTRMVEVGTTNRTHPEDYTGAINESTRILFKANRSNFSMEGFTAEVSLETLVKIASERDLLVVYDEGSGLISDAEDILPQGHISVESALSKGVDLVCFSGDKLLGGPQAGIIAGRADLVTRLRKHQLTRVIRNDKMSIAALEATLRIHLGQHGGRKKLPVWRKLSYGREQMESRARLIAEKLADALTSFNPVIKRIDEKSAVGGGSFPGAGLPTVAVSLAFPDLSPAAVASSLLEGNPPVVVRIRDDRVLIDPRTIEEDEIDLLIQVVTEIVSGMTEEGGE